MTHLWKNNGTQNQFFKWMQYSIKNSASKSDALAIQAKLDTQQKAAQTAFETASAKAKIADKTLKTDEALLVAATKVHAKMANSASDTLLAKAA